MQHAQHIFPPTLPIAASAGSLIRSRHWFADRVLAIAAGYIRNRALRKAEQHLLVLDDRILKDIGIERSEIRSLVWGGPVGERRHSAAQSDQAYGSVGTFR
jgi:uncharacterized protein YjiS (DUF1127 family)